jgi:peptidylprolyl isomerase
MRLLQHWLSLHFPKLLGLPLGDRNSPHPARNLASNPLVRLGCTLLLAIALCFAPAAGANAASGIGLIASLPQGNAITDPKALLRLSLPIDNPAVREIQTNLEDISLQLRGKRWSAINGDLSQAKTILRDRTAKLLATVPESDRAAANQLIPQIDASLTNLQGFAAAKDRDQVLAENARVLDLIGELEALMVQKYPFQIPDTYRNLPQLQGRATVAMETSKGRITLVADGYSAPVTAGNFVDLVKRGFYNGLEFTRAEQSYVLQAGDPKGAAEGFIDPQTKQYRAIPLEILVKGDPKPLYGITLEDAGRYLDQPVLPFSAYGTVALARPNDDPNGGSSQFFFLLFEAELTPAGANLLDGRYAVFGYVVEGAEVLGELREGDKILSAQVMDGGENLVTPKG